VAAALALALLLSLFLAPREGSRYGLNLPAPDGVFVGPQLPSAAEVEAARKIREAAAAKAALTRAGAAKPEKRRKKRVSMLREPGDAMGGGVRLTLTDKRTGRTPKK